MPFLCTYTNLFSKCISIVIYVQREWSVLEILFTSWCFHSAFFKQICQNMHKNYMMESEVRVTEQGVLQLPLCITIERIERLWRGLKIKGDISQKVKSF